MRPSTGGPTIYVGGGLFNIKRGGYHKAYEKFYYRILQRLHAKHPSYQQDDDIV
jgi:hypothetical protein